MRRANMDTIDQGPGGELLSCHRLTLNIRWHADVAPSDMATGLVELMQPLIDRNEILTIEAESPDIPGSVVFVVQPPADRQVDLEAIEDTPGLSVNIGDTNLTAHMVSKIMSNTCLLGDHPLPPDTDKNPCQECIDTNRAPHEGAQDDEEDQPEPQV